MKRRNQNIIDRGGRNKKKNSTAKKAFILGFVLFFVLFGGIAVYIVLGSYDYNFSKAIEGIFAPKVETLTPQQQEALPEIAGKANFFVTCTSDQNKNVYMFAVIRADLNQKKFIICALPPRTLIEQESSKETLESIYLTKGISKTVQSVERLFGITISRNARVTNRNFVKFADKLGGISFRLEEDVSYDSPEFTIRLKAGEQKLAGGNILYLMRCPQWSGGYSKQYEIQMKLMSAMFTQMLNERNVARGEAFFNELVNLFQTDISITDYKNNMTALDVISKSDIKTESRLLKGQYSFSLDIQLVDFTPDADAKELLADFTL